ncbi:TetR/AcrR family transcriptional regulator [Gulosibacter molinativorax]|uniref:TetR/AcrR family transcriptional regulator n=1 Tax=Gulosibacter molinativorax TaxID=256821 RepID=A0ABT7C9A5_9MICO|nr:TetR/AcrR family transcriptional regulator [Gulosibacter molinativorax]MDJ1371221.1 TetR/AcrR family transcriptional regulator [Gulosibacter molinativorax]QUY63037.1 HTH-type transcriptional regulator BetI [Gulosibacter molinativorax]
MSDGYHHGDLKSAVLRRALEVIEQDGVQALSLRSIAADIGVSHTAPRHHFGDLRGLRTAIAAEGFRMLGRHLIETRESGGEFLDVGVAYVEFALAHKAHMTVMFAPTLLDAENTELIDAKDLAFGELRGGVDAMAARGAIEDAAAAVIAGWGLVHGIATLGITGNLQDSQLGALVADGDLLEITRRAARMLYGSPGSSEQGGPAN